MNSPHLAGLFVFETRRLLASQHLAGHPPTLSTDSRRPPISFITSAARFGSAACMPRTRAVSVNCSSRRGSQGDVGRRVGRLRALTIRAGRPARSCAGTGTATTEQLLEGLPGGRGRRCGYHA